MTEWGTGELGGHTYLHYTPLSDRGVRHGFFFGSLNAAGEIPVVQAAWSGGGKLRLLTQEHGTGLVSADSPAIAPCADGWLVAGRQRDAVVLGIRTADCMPILLSSGGRAALIHAGWRGLAAGIVERAVLAVQGAADEPLLVIIGPAAGMDDYPIGEDILSDFRRPPLLHRAGGRLLLDLAGSAEAEVREVSRAPVTIVHSGISTISDRRFHSHRRDGALAGRNLTVLYPGAPAATE